MAQPRSFSALVLAELPPAVSRALAAAPDAAGGLEGVLEQARAGWPELKIKSGPFARQVARALAAAPQPARALVDLHGADLYLAGACADGDESALLAFRKRLRPRLRGAVAKVSSDREFIQEVEDRLLEKLLVGGAGGRPRIAEYAGRGSLASWVCVAAVRTALEVARLKSVPVVPLDSVPLGASVSASPDLALIKRQHSADFKRAFEDAFHALPAEDRNLLRLSVIDDLGIDKLAGVFGAHRSTVARRLQRVRTSLVERTRQLLATRLGLRGADLDSLIRVVRSELHLSLSRLVTGASRTP